MKSTGLYLNGFLILNNMHYICEKVSDYVLSLFINENLDYVFYNNGEDFIFKNLEVYISVSTPDSF
jgi:hypothetical protein